jgi:hypothetical protein
MAADLQIWLTVTVNAAAAIVFLAFGRHQRDRLLLGVGLAFVAATALLAGARFFDSPATTASGFTIGLIASLLGLLGVLKAYIRRRNSKGERAM